ncbi:hypothetical protein PP740_gp007 [Stenotrophomonas phage Philippe]|uniref:Uncharacterized protein n=1 Tax=Stenotrophomonas phage Philippe TaxID=2859655 RepID=A0AAE7WMH5_9CAUD|nr:hypothetical protein PP740_gp007 [Stenotrophomonas phage Philippe]QYW02206.1 hypothetical protein CPT_Philippe_007 [Stenotrophomonas phage Philippe]
MAVINEMLWPDDEHMVVDHQHAVGRQLGDRSKWIYWDMHIPSYVMPRHLVVDDFGNLTPIGD